MQLHIISVVLSLLRLDQERRTEISYNLSENNITITFVIFLVNGTTWIFVFLEKRSQVTLWKMIHVLATALVTQRISEEISGAGVLIASKVAIGDLSFLFPGWRCPPADCQLPLRQEGAECTCSCSIGVLQSPFHSSLLPASFLQPFFSSSQQFNIHFGPNFLHISPWNWHRCNYGFV